MGHELWSGGCRGLGPGAQGVVGVVFSSWLGRDFGDVAVVPVRMASGSWAS